MNLFIISYGIIEFDGRLKSIIGVAKNIGDVHLCCCTKYDKDDLYAIRNKYMDAFTYLGFIRYVVKKLRKEKPDIIISDNLFASIPTLLSIRNKKKVKIIQDVRELYFIKDLKKSAKIFAYFENKLMHRSDIILCANEERASIMTEKFSLSCKPIVFENIRFLTGTYDEEKMRKKYDGAFKYQYNLISTSGLFMERNTDQLIKAMGSLDTRFGLFIVGTSSTKDVETMNEICSEYGIKNVHLIDKVPMNELLYIIRQCQIGIVHYHQNDLNNKYCASGKVYEF